MNCQLVAGVGYLIDSGQINAYKTITPTSYCYRRRKAHSNIHSFTALKIAWRKIVIYRSVDSVARSPCCHYDRKWRNLSFPWWRRRHRDVIDRL